MPLKPRRLFRAESIEKHRRLIVSALFGCFLVVGLLIFRDYGVHCDEFTNQHYGADWARYVSEFLSKGSQARIPVLRNWDFTHGHTYPILMFSMEKALKLKDSRDVLLLRHLLVFLTFYLGVVFLYLLCEEFFFGWRTGLIAGSILILQPRIFAHSFFNSVDIPFLSFYIIGTYTLLKFLKGKSRWTVLWHSLTGAVLMGIRMVGAVIPLATVLFGGLSLIKQRKSKAEFKKRIAGLLLYVCLTSVFLFLLEPLLWNNPLQHLVRSLTRSKFNIYRDVVPWTYNFKFILMTTPFLFSVLFLAGLVFLGRSLLKAPANGGPGKRDLAILGFLFIVPLVLPIVFQTRLFDDWRHHYFVYPMFALFTAAGITGSYRWLKVKFGGAWGTAARTAFVLIVAAGMLWTIRFMIQFHPFQCVYANSLAGPGLEAAKVDRSLDYWGLSYRAALEDILRRDRREVIKVFGDNIMAGYNAKILPPSGRDRLRLVEKRSEADYFVSNFRWHRGAYPRKQKVFALVYRGARFMVVYKLERREKKIRPGKDTGK